MLPSRPASREGFIVSFARKYFRKHRRGGGHVVLAPMLLFFAIAGAPRSFSPERASASPLNGQTTIAVTANLVLLPVRVTDARGTFVSGLTLQNFRVYEDGQLQTLSVFEEEDTPVTVGLIVDHSRSMGSKLSDVVVGVLAFAHSSNPHDEMFVVDFNDDVSVELMNGKAFSSDPAELDEALTAVSARGRTALYDAVSEGLQHLQYGHLEKKALVIISDGGDNASHLKYAQVLAQARQSQAAIYAIVLVDPNDGEEENPELLKRICKDTGGIAYFPGAGETVATVSGEIARDLRQQYTLGYAPQNMGRAGTFRKVEVKVIAPGHHGKLVVRTRQGYSLAVEKRSTAQSGTGAR
jgi:Ca-activated chloride channel homolog